MVNTCWCRKVKRTISSSGQYSYGYPAGKTNNMNRNRTPEFSLDSFSFVNFIIRYRRVFFWTAVISFVVSAGVSLLLKPLYRSTVTLYPASTIGENAPSLFETGSINITFGDEAGTEKILQILQSDEIRDYLIYKYDLFGHYGIDPEAKYCYTLLNARMNKYITSRKTQYMSVQLSVLDRDPVIAAEMANDIAHLIDSTFNNLIRQAGRKQAEVLKNEYELQQSLVYSYEDSLEMEQGDIPLVLFSSGGNSVFSQRGSRAEMYRSVSVDLLKFSSLHEMALEDLGRIRQKYTEAQMAADQDMPYTLVVNRARVSERKAFPKRSVITMATTISTLIFVLVLLIFLEGFRKHSTD